MTLNSENWEEWDLGKLPLLVFTPEELNEGGRMRGGETDTARRERRDD